MSLLRRWHFAMGRRVPDRDSMSLIVRPFAWRMLPPIYRPRMVVVPNYYLALVPVAIVIEPHTDGPACAE